MRDARIADSTAGCRTSTTPEQDKIRVFPAHLSGYAPEQGIKNKEGGQSGTLKKRLQTIAELNGIYRKLSFGDNLER